MEARSAAHLVQLRSEGLLVMFRFSVMTAPLFGTAPLLVGSVAIVAQLALFCAM